LEKKTKSRFFKKIYNIALEKIFSLINGKFSISKIEKYFILGTKIFNKKKFKIFQIKNGKIYLDSSEEKYFYIKDNLILKNLSIDTEKLGKNSNILKFGITKFIKKKNLKVISIVSGRDEKNNYYHWLIDVLPKNLILEDEIKKNKIKNILVPNYEKRYQVESLSCFFKKNDTNFINLSQNKFLQFDNVIFCTNNSNFEFYNYDLLKKFQNKILKYIKLKKIKAKYDYKKIYIDRFDANKKKDRFLVNEKKLKNKLKKEGFKFITLSNYSFFEQVLIFNNAKLIVGLHGAGLANILFVKKTTKIIELTNSEWPDMYYKLSRCLNLNYNKIICNKVYKNLNIVECSIQKIMRKI